MRQDFFYPSGITGKIHGIRWIPEGEIRAAVQIVHGIAEFSLRYDEFARYLNSLGCLVVAEDHMGHGRSLENGGTRGYFEGGWDAAVSDTVRLISDTREAYPDVPYILFGHSMGSFMARTILCDYPQLDLDAAVICGTGWMPESVLKAGRAMASTVCRLSGERKPNKALQRMVFAGYNKRVEHPRTCFDWLTRDKAIVDAYIEDPLCGFTASAGLLRDMMGGMAYVQDPGNLARMVKKLPVLFLAGGDDPVGNYGEGVRAAAEAFCQAGMEQVDVKIYPLCRHEVLNEINRQEVYEDTAKWMLNALEEK